MAKEAEGDCHESRDGGCDIGGTLRASEVVAEDGDQDGHGRQTDQHCGSIDADTANPFNEVVSSRAEDEPLVSEEGRRDCDQVRSNRCVHIAVGLSLIHI